MAADGFSVLCIGSCCEVIVVDVEALVTLFLPSGEGVLGAVVGAAVGAVAEAVVDSGKGPGPDIGADNEDSLMAA